MKTATARGSPTWSSSCDSPWLKAARQASLGTHSRGASEWPSRPPGTDRRSRLKATVEKSPGASLSRRSSHNSASAVSWRMEQLVDIEGEIAEIAAGRAHGWSPTTATVRGLSASSFGTGKLSQDHLDRRQIGLRRKELFQDPKHSRRRWSWGQAASAKAFSRWSSGPGPGREVLRPGPGSPPGLKPRRPIKARDHSITSAVAVPGGGGPDRLRHNDAGRLAVRWSAVLHRDCARRGQWLRGNSGGPPLLAGDGPSVDSQPLGRVRAQLVISSLADSRGTADVFAINSLASWLSRRQFCATNFAARKASSGGRTCFLDLFRPSRRHRGGGATPRVQFPAQVRADRL